MKTEGIDHVVIAVKDLEGARKFFSELLDTSFEDLGTVEEMGLRSIMSPEGLELVTPITPESGLAKYMETSGEGVMAISFRVKDIEKATTEVKERGLRVVTRIERGMLGSFKDFKEIMIHPKGVYNTQLTFAEYESRGYKG